MVEMVEFGRRKTRGDRLACQMRSKIVTLWQNTQMTIAQKSEEVGVSTKTVHRWIDR